jgi:hypothetical protein
MTIVDIKREPETGQYTVQLRMTEVEALALAQQIVAAAEKKEEPPPPGGDAESEERTA